jgi:hypothetical protein
MNHIAVTDVHSLQIPIRVNAMKHFIVSSWDAVMNNQHNPLRHLDLASQHYFMQVLGWMWSMVFSLTFFSIFHFGFTWMAHVLVFAGVAMTVAVFRESERQNRNLAPATIPLSRSSRCVWRLDSEA